QPVLTQPFSISASPGSYNTLTCTLSAAFNVGSCAIHWFQQETVSPPWFLLGLRSDSDKHQGSGGPSHFSGSKGSWAEAVLTQPHLVSESLGQKATISCTLTSGDIGGNYVHWYQQHPGSAPTTMIYKDDQRPTGFLISSLAAVTAPPMLPTWPSLGCSLRMRLTRTVSLVMTAALRAQ
uniref:Immunoglobulin V-set domain-containing protein n=1 Tax=Equus asinus TaxID=9793 RepID=A0A9L0ID22_EQUAS